MATDVLRAFVVSLGARVDHAAFRGFDQSLGRTTRNVALLGSAVEAAFLGVNAWAAKVATSFDSAYFSSQRIGASVANIKAMTYGLSQMGSTAGAANASMESFAKTLRNNRGYYAVLERMGIGTKNADGTRRDATALMQEFGKALRSRSPELQHLYLEMFGIDDATGHALIKGVEKFSNEYLDKLRKAGLDPDQAARDGNALQTVFRSIGASIEVIGAKVASRLFSDQGNAFKKFIDFLDQHGDQIATIISKLAGVALQLAQAFIELATSDKAKAFLDGILNTFGKLDEKTSEFHADIDKLKLALEIFAGFVAGTWVMKILGAFGMVGGGWAALLLRLGIVGAGAHAYTSIQKGGLSGGVDPVTGSKAGDEVGSGLIAPGGEGGGRKYLRDLFSPQAGDNRTLKERLMPKSMGGKDAPGAGGGGLSSDGLQGLTPDQAANYADILGHRESRNRYGISNGPGFRGRWQMGAAALKDTGYVTTTRNHALTDPSVWRGKNDINNLEDFLGNKGGMQDKQFVEYTNQHYQELKRRGVIRDGMSPQEVAGWLAAAHLKGVGGAIELSRGRDNYDGNGTAASSYYRMMKNVGAARASRKPLTAEDIMPGGLAGAANGGIPALRIPSAPAPSVDQSRQSSVTINQAPITVTGLNDGKTIADRIDRVQGYRNSDLIRNMRSSVA